MVAITPIVVLQIVNAILASSPKIIETVGNVKALLDALFTAKLITADQQNALMAHVDAQAALAQAGVVPDHWQVEPDPVTPAQPAPSA